MTLKICKLLKSNFYYIKYILSTFGAIFYSALVLQYRFVWNSPRYSTLTHILLDLRLKMRKKNAAAEAAAFVKESCRLRS